ncbi:TPA: hypothetical protein QDB23_001680 [Burkholderia vietnamiensis]|nr:hypothetical protein [Burkholderia vietnamiensis]
MSNSRFKMDSAEDMVIVLLMPYLKRLGKMRAPDLDCSFFEGNTDEHLRALVDLFLMDTYAKNYGMPHTNAGDE